MASPCSRQIVLPRLRLRLTQPDSPKDVKVIFFIPSLKYVEVTFYIPWVVKLLEAEPEPQM